MGRRAKSLRAIAAELGCAVNTVRRHLDQPELPRYAKRQSPRPKLGPFEAHLRERIAQANGGHMPASVLAHEIRQLGYDGSDRQALRFVGELRSRAGGESALRVDATAGELMQVDWIEFARAQPDALAAFVAVLVWSRAIYVEYVSDSGISTLLGCHRRAFEFFGGVPRTLMYRSNCAAFANPDAYGPDRHRFDPTFMDFARHHGFVPRLLLGFGNSAKPGVDRINRYLRYSFHLPLLTRMARDGVDLDVRTANIEVQRWIAEIANVQSHGSRGRVPAVDLEVERRSLVPLPLPWRRDGIGRAASAGDFGSRQLVTLGRDRRCHDVPR